MQVTPTIAPWEWVFQHLQLIGWPAIVLVAWKASRFISKLEDRALAVETNIQEMKSNHLVHIETSLEAIDSGIQGMRDDMRTYWLANIKNKD